MDHWDVWQQQHPGTNISRWALMIAALDSHHNDWAYLNGPLKLPPKYDGRFGWWLD